MTKQGCDMVENTMTANVTPEVIELAVRLLKRDCGSHVSWETVSDEGKARWVEQAEAEFDRRANQDAPARVRELEKQLADAEERNSWLAVRVETLEGSRDFYQESLDSALNVLIRRINGEQTLETAAEWVVLNYPNKAELIAEDRRPDRAELLGDKTRRNV